MIRTFIITLLTINCLTSAQGSLEFISEKIDFRIDEKRFSVNGIYEFANKTDHEVRQSILFPFQEDTDSLTVKRVYDLTYGGPVDYKLLNDAIVFRISVFPEDTVKINVAYSQETRKENIYILKSAQAWKKALQSADFSLTVGGTVEVEEFSIPPDSVINGVFIWNNTDFFPEEDFRIRIK